MLPFAASVMLRQPYRLNDLRSLHPEATATTAASVMSQSHRVRDASCLHPEATATTAASVVLLQ